MKLYEITDELLDLYTMPIEGDDEGEDWQAFNELLEQLQDKLNEKAENIFKLIKNWKVESAGFIAQARAIEEEADRNRRKAEILDRKQEKLKEYVLQEMKKLQIDKLRTPMFNCGVRKAQPGIEVTDINALPDDLVNKEPKTIDIKRALLNGEYLNGAKLKEGKEYIVIL